MPERTLIALLRPDADDPKSTFVASPVVGLLDHRPRLGNVLNPLDAIATVRILHESHVLRMPRDAHGRIARIFVPDAVTPVAYNDPIVLLAPLRAGVDPVEPGAAAEAGGASRTGGAAAPGDGLEGGEEGLIEVKSPTVGVFYNRPSPEAAPFVQAGSAVSAGNVLGLVEVMKSFNQIIYGGPGLPERGEVAQVLVSDNAEVVFGQVLFRIRPVAL